jgi:hypothetical protein
MTESRTFLHGVKDVSMIETQYRKPDGAMRFTRDVVITLADGGAMTICCFIEEGTNADARRD